MKINPKHPSKMLVNTRGLAQAQAHFNTGLAFHQKGQMAQAQEAYNQALKLQADHFEALHLSGVIAAQTKNFTQALGLIDKALAIHAGNVSAWNNRGNTLRDMKRFQDAIESYDKALTLKPDYAEAYYNRGNVLRDSGQYAAAVDSYDRAIGLRSDYAEAHNSRGNALRDLLQPQAALQSYEKAISLKSDYAVAYSNRGAALGDLKHYAAAIRSYDTAIALDPHYAAARLDRSLDLLKTGNFQLGWAEYEWRWIDKLEDVSRRFPHPRWTGAEPLHGKTILLHSEQGLGDTIQFCRYAKLVSGFGARVILEVQEPLMRVLTSLEGVEQLVARGKPLPPFDCQCPLISLPLAFKTRLENIPSANAYLTSLPDKLAQWEARLGEKTHPRVGMVWSGSAAHKNDHNRSIPLADFIKSLPSGIQYVSLQKAVREADQHTLNSHSGILDLGREIEDFTDTAAVCELMEVVVSVDTSVAHLAGALGKAVWVLLPFNPDWRWLTDRNDSPWYSSARLFRQSHIGDWSDVISRMGEALKTNTFPLQAKSTTS
jgi:tetratricopeptide (TPR) repeat protein